MDLLELGHLSTVLSGSYPLSFLLYIGVLFVGDNVTFGL